MSRGGYLIHFDEERRNYLLREVHDPSRGFSDALSSADWQARQWEVCGLLFDSKKITHWALARKRRRVATAKAKVEFTEVVEAPVRIADLLEEIGKSVQRHIISSRSGSGGPVPPVTWLKLKQALREISPVAYRAVQRLERLRDQSASLISRPGTEVVAQERDAVGLALEVFDQTGRVRKETLQGWTAPEGNRLSSFLDGLVGVRTIEDQLIARDAASFPQANAFRRTSVGAAFSTAGRKLEVLNVNRTRVEHSLGVDLIYFHEEFDAWTMVQYKCMKTDAGQRQLIYRPDEKFDDEIGRMCAFRERHVDSWSPRGKHRDYRLSADGFFFKFCSRVQLEVMSDALLPGMYLSREHTLSLLADTSSRGPRGGRQITFENCDRHLSNTLFADLLRDGWIGTRSLSSSQIANLVQQGLEGSRSVVIARARPPGDRANLEQTWESLGLTE